MARGAEAEQKREAEPRIGGPARMNSKLSLLLRLLRLLRIRRVGRRFGGDRCHVRGTDGGQLGRLVLGSADIAVDRVFVDAIHDDLHGLRIGLGVNPDGLVEIHLFLLKLIVVHNHRHVVVLVLRIGLAEGQRERADALELFGLGEVELEVAALAALFEGHEFLVGLGNGTVQVIASGIDGPFKVRTVLRNFVLRFLQ